jgi:hypothetical protein
MKNGCEPCALTDIEVAQGGAWKNPACAITLSARRSQRIRDGLHALVSHLVTCDNRAEPLHHLLRPLKVAITHFELSPLTLKVYAHNLKLTVTPYSLCWHHKHYA